MINTDLIAAAGIGLAGAGHCLGMCGGIAAAINLGGNRGIPTTLAYHIGRLSSYAALGALLGALAGSINFAQWTMVLRYVAALLLIGMGLSIADWWRGMSILERFGARLWKPVQRLSSTLLPVQHWTQSYLLGLCWGLMPCGLIYSALAWSATAQDAVRSGALMLAFGVGTLPAMLSTSLGAAQVQALLRRRGLKIIIAIFLIASGLWSLMMTWNHGAHLNRPVGAEAATPSVDHSQMNIHSDNTDPVMEHSQH
ncbi:sulfite exporter TauE/SafE family protein [Congregibacter variabilis]|uniref:Sulfite exporter TauE/SafE family protein n=1 Tax=Congregibacter variabilis TaxID=3081200 RepID=A0ABZ0I314_9GAMM|nr:sulfite exporter TauE/SafE family protein [Congregibacter sp. IMCC43200]